MNGLAGLVTRRRAPEDRADCYNVYYRSVREGAARYYDAAQRKAWAPEATPDLSEPDRMLEQDAWVAELSGEICGFMTLDKTGYLDMAFVLPEVMGKGVSDALYAMLLNHARTCGFARLTVDASHFARSFFVRHGWHVVEREMHPAHGQVYERFKMVLDLKEPT